MHTEHDALPVVAGNGDSSLFVAATLAALVLAGSALVYRKTFEQQPEREKLTQPLEQPSPDDMDTEKSQSLHAHRFTDGLSSIHDPDLKESKSSRSKDRRRRGKDPLKEILKGGKKVKSTMPIKQLFTSKPVLDELDNLNNINNIPTSLTPGPSSTYNSTPVDSRTTSEVSPNTGSTISDSCRRTASTSISDHHVSNPSQSSSSSSSHNETEENTSISGERNPDILSREIRETHLADHPPSNIFSTIQNDDFTEIVNHSLPSSASSATNTATTSCVITPATSPSLSFTSFNLVPGHVEADLELALNNGSGSDCGPKNNNNPVSADPSHALGADTKSRNISRKQQPSPNPTSPKSKSKSKINALNPWEWDNTGEAPPSSSSISASVMASAPTSSLITAALPPDAVYRKPPRLQPRSHWSKKAKRDVIPGSASHPSLLSPTSGSFVSSDSALLSPSMSSSPKNIPNRVSNVAEEDEGDGCEEERADDSYTQLEFPTLNPVVSTSTSLTSSSGPIASSSAASPSNNLRPTTPRRGHSSRRPPTPSGSTPPTPSNSGSVSAQPPSTPAVSTQTQLASLRGALEAARLREEKHKAEMETYTKELDALRWENANSRRGEVELQNQIRHLMHQLQMYSSLFATATPQPASQQQPPQQPQGVMSGTGLSNLGDRSTSSSGSGSGNGPTTASSPGTQNVPSSIAAVVPGPPVSSPPMLLHMLPTLPLNALSSASSMSAPSPYYHPMSPPSHPLSAMPSPHPFFAQQFHHMQQQFLQFQHFQQPHMQNPSQSPTIQAQGNSLSMLRQPSLASISSYQSYTASSSSSMASGSRSSSRPGTESAGSSPDLNGSLSPGPGSKRKVTRTRTQTANGYIGGRAGRKGTSDNWIVGGVGIDEGDEDESTHECKVEGENSDEDESGFNEILADAILKRPDSIGVRSGKKNKQASLEKETEEENGKNRELEQLENNILDVVEPLTEFKFPSLSDLGNVYYGGCNQSSSLVVSPPEDLASNVFNQQALVNRPSQDGVHTEAVVLQNGVELESRHENRPTSKTASSSSESEKTPRREESESIITGPSTDLNGAEQTTNVSEAQ